MKEGAAVMLVLYLRMEPFLSHHRGHAVRHLRRQSRRLMNLVPIHIQMRFRDCPSSMPGWAFTPARSCLN